MNPLLLVGAVGISKLIIEVFSGPSTTKENTVAEETVNTEDPINNKEPEVSVCEPEEINEQEAIHNDEAIEYDDIHKVFLINQDEEGLTDTVLKRKITRATNKIIRQSKGYRIEKSGTPEAGALGYSEMYLLCKSSNSELINELTAYYNNKYAEDQNNEGGNSESADTKGDSYLYILSREE